MSMNLKIRVKASGTVVAKCKALISWYAANFLEYNCLASPLQSNVDVLSIGYDTTEYRDYEERNGKECHCENGEGRIDNIST